jgi:hypothetical protein
MPGMETMRVMPNHSLEPTRRLPDFCRHSNLTEPRLFNQLSTCPQPNWRFNVDANMGHRFAILMAHVGALRPCRASGAS